MPSPGYQISGKEIEVHGSGSPLLFPVTIRAQLAGCPWFPAPSAVSPLRSPVNPNPCDTFSWPTSKNHFTPFLSAASLPHSSKLLRECSASLPHLASQLPKLCGKGSPKAMWFSLSHQSSVGTPLLQSHVVPPSMGAAPGFKSQHQSSISNSSHNWLHLSAFPYFSSFSGLP